MKLFEITNDIQNIFNNIGEDGELTQEMLDGLDGLQQDFEQKAIAVAAYIKNIEAEETAIAAAIKNMAERKQKLTNKLEGLTHYLQSNLQKLSISEIKSSPYFKIRLKQCPPSVDVFDEKQIPPEYWREKIVTSIDKIKLKEVMNEGVEVPGVTIQRKIKLEIK
jgi:hypothetical protein